MSTPFWQVWLGQTSNSNPAGSGSDASINSNVLKQTYINRFLDVSGTLTVRYDASINGNLYLGPTSKLGIGVKSPVYTLDQIGTHGIKCPDSASYLSYPNVNPETYGIILTTSKSTPFTKYTMGLGIDYSTGYGYINTGYTSSDASNLAQPLLLQTTGGDVGIGNLNPTAALFVVGNQNKFGTAAGPGGSTFNSAAYYGNNGIAGNTIASFVNVIPTNTGTTNSAVVEIGALNRDIIPTNVQGTVYKYALSYHTNSTGSDLEIKGITTGANFQADGTPVSRVYITASGNIGMGITNPQYNLDVSGTARFSSDVSINGNLVVRGTFGVQQLQSRSIINTTTTNYQLIVSEDISLNGRLFVSGDVSLNSRVFIGGDISLNSRVFIGGDVSLNSRVFIGGDVSLNSRLLIGGDSSLNGRLYVRGDLSLGGNLTVLGNAGITLNYTLPYVTLSPNSANATSNTWSTTYMGGTVNWTATSSAPLSTVNNQPFCAFNGSITGTSWLTQNSASGKAAVFSTITTILAPLSITTPPYAYIQIQSSISIILDSFRYAATDLAGDSFNTFYILGSADGTNWYPILYAAASTGDVFPTLAYSSNIYMVTASRNVGGGGTLSTTSYSTSANSYTYFRFAVLSNNGNHQVGINELELNFKALFPRNSYAAFSMNSLNVNQLDISSGILNVGGTPIVFGINDASNTYKNVYGKAPPTNVYGNLVVSPNSKVATTTTWVNNNITWTSSASTVQPSGGPFSSNLAFNTTFAAGVDKWETSLTKYTSGLANSTAALTTNIFGQSAQRGEWLQIQSSVPVVMTSYSLASHDTTTRLPKTFWIVGSNDGNNWFQIQAASCGETAYSSGLYTMSSTFLVNSASAQTSGAATLTTTINPPYTTSAFTYFRLICLSIFSTTETLVDIGEWLINFSVAQTGPSRTLLYMDASNINQLDVSGSLGLINSNASTMTVTPNTTAATSSPGYTWQNNNITWVASNTLASSNPLLYLAFNNYFITSPGSNANTWNTNTVTNFYNGSPTGGAYAGTTNTPVSIGGAAATTVSGEWLQIQSSVPVIMANYFFTNQTWGTGYQYRLPLQYTIAGSNDGNTWVDIQDGAYNAMPITNTGITMPATDGTKPYSTATYNVSTATSTAGGTLTTLNNNAITTYSTSTASYTHFRIIIKRVFSGMHGTTSLASGNAGFFWNINFIPTTSSVSLALDNAVPNQLNVGGALGIAGGITPMYSVPSFGPGQVGYVYFTNSIPSVSNVDTVLASYANSPVGVYTVHWSHTIAPGGISGQRCDFWVNFGSTTMGSLVTNNPNGISFFNVSASTAGTITTSGQAITWYGRSSLNNWWVDRGYFVAVRIA